MFMGCDGAGAFIAAFTDDGGGDDDDICSSCPSM
jgi:hypothetical protein